MLGKEKENGRVKVDRYWPEEGESPLHFHNIRVALKEKVYDAGLGIAVRKLELTYFPFSPHFPHSSLSHPNAHPQAQTRQVLHYQYEGWPDHGVPSSAAAIRQLVRIIEQERYYFLLILLTIY
jgi:protein tyrosine phosphatase